MKIEFIIATHKNLEHLKGMVACLESQTNSNWNAHIICDGFNAEIDNWVFANCWKLDKFDFNTYFSGPSNDFGHTPIQHIKRFSESELLVMTSDDNYYVPTFVEEMLNVFKYGRVNFAYCNMVHNSFGYQVLDAKLKRARIDLGSFVTRTEMAKQIKLGSGYEDDYEFARQYVQKFCPSRKNIVKVKKVLYVHN